MPLAARGADVKTLPHAAREFWARRSPKVIAAGIVAVLVLRLALDAPDWRDLVAVAGMVALYPFAEWAIHLHLLHLPPLRWRGREYELPTARAHRMHHENPHSLNSILLGPGEALALLVGLVPVVVAAGCLLIGALSAAVPLSVAVTAVLAGFVLIAVYEWTHFLIHTAVRPRSRHYKAIHRGHRLHHFKNEHYWHGVATTAADRLLGTAPAARAVERSHTARTLREDQAGSS
jgi:sterol desaturase/sphingolipid hydroxylase (fatty acid hydroxylase superfamily)